MVHFHAKIITVTARGVGPRSMVAGWWGDDPVQVAVAVEVVPGRSVARVGGVKTPSTHTIQRIIDSTSVTILRRAIPSPLDLPPAMAQSLDRAVSLAACVAPEKSHMPLSVPNEPTFTPASEIHPTHRPWPGVLSDAP